MNHRLDAVADTEAHDTSHGTDDDEKRTSASGVAVEKVGDGDDVGTDKGEVVSGNDPDVGEPVVVGRVGSSKTVKHTAEDSDKQGDDEREDTVLRLVDTTVALSAPLDKSVGAGTEKGKSDDGNDDLTNVDVTGLVLLPVVWGSSDNVAISRADGDVGTKSQTVEAKSPENIGEKKKAKHLLVHVENLLHVGLANPQTQVRAESARGVADKVQLGSDGAKSDRGRGLLDSLLDVEVVLGSLLVGRKGTLVLGLGQEEKSSDEHTASETSTKTVPTLGSDFTGDRAGKDRVDGGDDDLNGLLGHEVLAALVEEVHFLGDHGNEGLALSSSEADDAASSKVEFISLGCSAHD